MNIKFFVFQAVVLAFLFSSCGDDRANSSDLDEELLLALKRSGDGSGAAYYLFPESDDFGNIPQDPNNPLTKDKVALGRNLYHDTGFATKGEFPITVGEYSCASCHHAAAGFQSGIAQGIGEGGEGFGLIGESRTRNLLCAPEKCDVQPLRSPTTLNVAYQPLMLWNGQFGATSLNEGTEDMWTEGTPKSVNFLGFEGIETQAIAGIDVHRIEFTKDAIIENGYKEIYDKVFADVDEEERYSKVTSGLAIAAYERTLLAYNSPFQKYLRGNTYGLSDYTKEGAILFFGKAGCVSCHNGPALNNMNFHALGMNEFDQSMVTHYKLDDPSQFGRFQFTQREEDKYKFKTPQLYNLKNLGFLGHGASFSSIKDVIAYKNKGQAQNPNVSDQYLDEKFVPLGLTDLEIDKISQFIEHGLYDNDLVRYVPSSLPSGLCFPNADPVSMADLGCN